LGCPWCTWPSLEPLKIGRNHPSSFKFLDEQPTHLPRLSPLFPFFHQGTLQAGTQPLCARGEDQIGLAVGSDHEVSWPWYLTAGWIPWYRWCGLAQHKLCITVYYTLYILINIINCLFTRKWHDKTRGAQWFSMIFSYFQLFSVCQFWDTPKIVRRNKQFNNTNIYIYQNIRFLSKNEAWLHHPGLLIDPDCA